MDSSPQSAALTQNCTGLWQTAEAKAGSGAVFLLCDGAAVGTELKAEKDSIQTNKSGRFTQTPSLSVKQRLPTDTFGPVP